MKTMAEIKNYEAFRDLDLSRRFSALEFEKFVVAAFTCDLLYGNIIDWGSGDMRQGIVKSNLLHALWQFDKDQKLGLELSGVHVNFSPDTTLTPGVAFWSARRVPPMKDSSVKITPDLIVEVLKSPEVAEDWWPEFMAEKLKIYQAAAVPLIWLVQPETQQVEVYHSGHSKAAVILSGAEAVLSGEEILPGFTLSLTQLFEL